MGLMQFFCPILDSRVHLPRSISCFIKSSLLTRDPIPDVKTAFSIISREESHRGLSSSFRNKARASVFAAKVHNNNNIKRNPSAKNPNLVCTNPDFPTFATPSLTTDQVQQLINMLNSKPQSNIHADMPGLTIEFRPKAPAITTRSGVAYKGPSIPTNPSPKKIVEGETEETTDKEQSNFQGSTAQIPPPVAPISILEPDVPKTLPKTTPIPEPDVSKNFPKPNIPYPS
ncbi:hypothetical protein Tco_1185744 [Tanacetum coccineum]